MKITHERLLEVLHYEPLTGVFTWLKPVSRRVRVGEVAGTVQENHRRLRVDYRLYYEHVLAWFYMKGEWPVDLIDHRDTDGFNNRFANLRPADVHINAQNRRVPTPGTASGFLGVHRHPDGWRAKISYGGKQHSLGVHATPEIAHAAYVAAKRIHHPGGTL